MKYSCRDFESRVGDYLQDILPAGERTAAAEHVSACPRCRRMYLIARGEVDLLTDEAQQSLALQILMKTSGATCGRAREALCDRTDGRLCAEDDAILEQHLNGCRACSEVALILSEVRESFPKIAEIEPDSRFTGDVLAVTTNRPQPAAGLGVRLAEFWSRVIHRPRIAWEAAYVMTLLLMFVVFNPAVTSLGASRPLGEAGSVARQAWERTFGEVQVWSGAATADMGAAAGALAGNVTQGRTRVARLMLEFQSEGKSLVRAAMAMDPGRLGSLSGRILKSLEQFWKDLGLDRTFSRTMR